MSKKYTKQKLVNELYRFVIENNRVPRANDMKVKNGYPSYDAYVDEFGSWNELIQSMDFCIDRGWGYTDKFLIEKLYEFVNKYKHTPTKENFKKLKQYPHPEIYVRHFGSWNKALQVAELPLNKVNEILTGEERCEMCGCKTTNYWSVGNNRRICNRCNASDRLYIKGILDPNCSTAIGIITEHVVGLVLCDVINCNTPENFHHKFDLVSEKYGTIDVKSRALVEHSRWVFSPNKIYHPNYYICLGFDENKTKILRVWMIPGTAEIWGKYSISITNSERALKRTSQYEVDPTPYNEIYQNLDIYSLPEFCNLTKDDST